MKNCSQGKKFELYFRFSSYFSSATIAMYDLDKKEGNTGLMGRYFWRIEDNDGTGALEKCFSWVLPNIDISVRNDISLKDELEMACPCTFWQALLDWGRFSWSWRYSWPKLCFESRRSKFVFSDSTSLGRLRLRQECCYSTDSEDWGALKLGPPDGGHMKVTALHYGSRKTFPSDEEAYKYCCDDTPLCDKFYRFRPSDSCSLYRPPPRRTCY